MIGDGLKTLGRDGDVQALDIAEIVAAGADTLVAGSAVFGAPDNDGGYRNVMRQLRQNASNS